MNKSDIVTSHQQRSDPWRPYLYWWILTCHVTPRCTNSGIRHAVRQTFPLRVPLKFFLLFSLAAGPIVYYPPSTIIIACYILPPSLFVLLYKQPHQIFTWHPSPRAAILRCQVHHVPPERSFANVRMISHLLCCHEWPHIHCCSLFSQPQLRYQGFKA
jgi:hypothetical protein